MRSCNENVLLWFNYRANAEKMQKEMPTYLEKQWVCPECGENHADYEEVAAKYKLLGMVDIGVMYFWVFSIVVAILIWAIEFQMEGIMYLLLTELIIFLLAMFVRYRLRKSMVQLQHDLIKLER